MLLAIVLIILCWAGLNGWVLATSVQYRAVRQDEFLHMLATAAENNVPIVPALQAFVADRARGSVRELIIATVQFFLLPGYYWFWHRSNSYDRKVQRVLRMVENGLPLSRALEAEWRVMSLEGLHAVAIGEQTGELARALTAAARFRRRVQHIWLQLLPRLVYPLILPLLVGSILSFIYYFIVPKFQKIFLDFGMPLPRETNYAMAMGGLFILGELGFLFLAFSFGMLAALSSTVRWYFPIVGGLYRLSARARVYQSLSLLLHVGRPVPESLRFLTRLPFRNVVVRRLDRARRDVEQGVPLAESLQFAGLLARSAAPLVQAAERTGNLPWVLNELAESLRARMARRIEWVLAILFPVFIVVIGAGIGQIVMGLFMPIVRLIEALSIRSG